jgi:hypothetical protein
MQERLSIIVLFSFAKLPRSIIHIISLLLSQKYYIIIVVDIV